MTKAPVLVAGEEQQVCILSGIVDGLEDLAKHTVFRKWNMTFVQCHDALDSILQERFLYFKDGGALQRLKDRVDRIKIGYLTANNNYTRDGEDTFKCKVAADDIYDMAASIQEANCQECHKDKSQCWIYNVFKRYDIEKFDDTPEKGVCPYSVIIKEVKE